MLYFTALNSARYVSLTFLRFTAKKLILIAIFFRKYDACSPTPCYRTADDSMQIKPDDEIRVKVISIREDANDIFVLGTLLDDFLGLVSSD